MRGNSADIVVRLAAVLGVFAFGWNVYVAWRDRGYIKADCWTERSDPLYPSPLKLEIDAVNRGRRPVQLITLSGRNPGWGKGWKSHELGTPIRLQEGEQWRASWFADDLARLFDGQLPTGLRLWDTRRRTYLIRGSRRRLRELAEQKRRAAEQHPQPPTEAGASTDPQ